MGVEIDDLGDRNNVGVAFGQACLTGVIIEIFSGRAPFERGRSPRNQAVAKSGSSPMETYFCCGLGDVELLGDLAMRQAMDIAKHHHVAESLGKIVQRLAKSSANRAVLELELGVGIFAMVGEVNHRVDVVVAVTLASPHERRCAVRGYAMQPCRETGIATKLAQAAKGSDIGVLDHVVGVVFVAGQAKRQRVHPLIGGFDEFVECRPIAGFGPGDEWLEFVVHIRSIWRGGDERVAPDRFELSTSRL